MSARFFIRGIGWEYRKIAPTTPHLYAIQVDTRVRPIKASAVQRGHRPTMSAIGPATSIATSTVARTFG
jgi:hypothetical protein